jgi:hypothetical protein
LGRREWPRDEEFRRHLGVNSRIFAIVDLKQLGLATLEAFSRRACFAHSAEAPRTSDTGLIEPPLTMEDEMRKTSAILCGAAAVMMLAGCVAGGGYGRSGGHSRVGVSYTAGYYDGYYGPYSGGYWASDGYFYYMDKSHNYQRDQSRHFRRDRFKGAKTVEAEDRTRDRNQNNKQRDSNQNQRDGNQRDRDNR